MSQKVSVLSISQRKGGNSYLFLGAKDTLGESHRGQKPYDSGRIVR